MSPFEALEAANNQNFRTLLDFSLGRMDDLKAMAALGIDSDEDLFLLMAQAHLPMPRLPEASTQRMTDELKALTVPTKQHLMHKPQWPVRIVGMVLHEVTRDATPIREKIAQWVALQAVEIVSTRTCAYYQTAWLEASAKPRTSNLGELAIQETMHDLALTQPDTTGVFLFEDRKIARASFLLSDNCRKISTRAWLLFLEGKGWIASAAQIERAAIANGRNFSRLRFPP